MPIFLHFDPPVLFLLSHLPSHILPMSRQSSYVVVAVGLEFEARIARRDTTAHVCCGRGPEMLAALNAAVTPRCSGILSFGVAGGLDPTLRPGAQVVASTVLTERETLATDESWSRSLMRSHPHAVHAPILSIEEPVVNPAGKNAHFERTGSVAVDMESHIAGRVAHKHRLPFAVLRVVADPATRLVPHAALSGLHPDGRTDALAVLRALIRRPSDIAGIIYIARDTWIARSTLLESSSRLGREFGLAGAAT